MLFQIYYILLIFCLSVLLIFESLKLKLQLKILIYLLLEIIIIHSGTTYNCSLFSKSPANVLSYFHNLEKKKYILLQVNFQFFCYALCIVKTAPTFMKELSHTGTPFSSFFLNFSPSSLCKECPIE